MPTIPQVIIAFTAAASLTPIFGCAPTVLQINKELNQAIRECDSASIEAVVRRSREIKGNRHRFRGPSEGDTNVVPIRLAAVLRCGPAVTILRDEGLNLTDALLYVDLGAINPYFDFHRLDRRSFHTSSGPRLSPADVAYLIEQGLGVEGSHGITGLHSLAGSGECVDCIDVLIDLSGADPNAQYEGGITPLHCAAREGRAAAADRLIQRGARPEARDRTGSTPARLAAARGYQALAETLAANMTAQEAASELRSGYHDYCRIRKGTILEEMRDSFEKGLGNHAPDCAERRPDGTCKLILKGLPAAATANLRGVEERQVLAEARPDLDLELTAFTQRCDRLLLR